MNPNDMESKQTMQPLSTQSNAPKILAENLFTQPSLSSLKRYCDTLSTNMEGIYLPFIAAQLGIPVKMLSRAVIRLYPESSMENNLLNLHGRQKVWWTELCVGITNRGISRRTQGIDQLLTKLKRTDVHVSVFDHDTAWHQQALARRSVSGLRGWVRASSVWIELDRKGDGGFTKALKDAEKFLGEFPHSQEVRLWHSGNQSVHIEINGRLFGNPSGRSELLCGRGGFIYNLAHDLFGSIRYEGGPVDPWMDPIEAKKFYKAKFGQIKQGFQQEIENIDPNIYSTNSLIRAKWSLHPKTGKAKRLLTGPENFSNIPPLMLDTYLKACETRKKKVKIPDISYDEDIIIQEFYDIEGFDPTAADTEGWVRGLYNPFYEDNKPSLSVNIYDGRFWDFGDPNHQFGFVKYLMLKHNWSYDRVNEYLCDTTSSSL
jgi:hypothetical protein